MSIQIVYGTSGIGKSTYIFNQINEQIKQKSPYKIKVITPEQFSYTAEHKLLETSSSQSMISAEVITFARMAYRILGEVGQKTRINLSGSGKAMLIDHILLTENNKFSFLGKSDENVEMISRQLTELKKHQVQLDILKEVTKNTQDKYLQKKLEDITNLYDLYNTSIQNQYIDENDGLTLLAEELEESNEFKNCDIYIDEFAGFTLQEYEILRKLMRISHKITITICADNLQENTNADIDTFYSNKQTVKRILEIANQEQIEVEKTIFLNTPYRFKTEELQHLAENMASPFYKKYDKQNENLSIFLASNPYSEIENVAIQITKLAKKGYKYEEMAVITKNIDTYSSLCKAIFEQYNIPVFIDEKKDLGSNILVRYVLSLLEIFAKNWSYESVFGYIKTGLLDLDTQEIAVLENYCLKWGIKGSKWYAKEWNFYNETEEQQKQIIYARDKVVEPLLKFKK
ncbi:MAG: PD-(D/E)XK nuclease family protein, partial [Clostridiales bacterium]